MKLKLDWWTRLSLDKREAFAQGSKDVSPFLFGTIPLGFVTGIAMVSSGLGVIPSVLMTVLVFAGTAQLSSLPLFTAGAPGWVIILTAFVVNLRFMIYSTAVAPYFRSLSLRWKLALGYFLTDSGFALFMRRIHDHPEMPNAHWYFIGGGCTIGSSWMLSAISGIILAAQIPPEWQLRFAATLGILAILTPFLRRYPDLVAAVVGGGVAVLAINLPMRLGLIAGILAGMSAGIMTEYVLTRFVHSESTL